jgi:hypothetical protein
MTAKVDDLRQARIQRINLSHASSSISQWLGLTLIAFLTHFVIAFAHYGRRYGSAAALGSFSIAAGIAMVYLAWSDGLLAGSKSASAITPLRELLQTVNAT